VPGVHGAFDRIAELADGADLVVPGHDPEVLERYPAVPGGRGGRAVLIA
jgi:hypothetical protein